MGLQKLRNPRRTHAPSLWQHPLQHVAERAPPVRGLRVGECEADLEAHSPGSVTHSHPSTGRRPVLSPDHAAAVRGRAGQWVTSQSAGPEAAAAVEGPGCRGRVASSATRGRRNRDGSQWGAPGMDGT